MQQESHHWRLRSNCISFFFLIVIVVIIAYMQVVSVFCESIHTRWSLIYVSITKLKEASLVQLKIPRWESNRLSLIDIVFLRLHDSCKRFQLHSWPCVWRKIEATIGVLVTVDFSCGERDTLSICQLFIQKAADARLRDVTSWQR